MKYWKDDKIWSEIFGHCMVLIIAITFFFSLYRIDLVKSWISDVVTILSPFIVGIIFSFLLRNPLKFIEFVILKNAKISPKNKHLIATGGAIAFGLLCVLAFILLLVPQLYQSVMTLVDNISYYIENFYEIMEVVMVQLHLDSNEIIKQIETSIPSTDKITEYVISWASVFLPNILTTTVNVASMAMNILIGVIVTVYILLDLKGFSFQTKRMLYAFLSNERADYIISVARLTDRIFNDFISGKIIDSIIIGILCYIGMVLFKMPFAILISVIVGVTNIIPFFGPFIGAIPGVFIVLVSSPSQAIWFALFILALQQFDGNILGPRILGDSIGLPAIWVMFAIIISGGLFGLSGMIVGVPTFAVIYFLIKERIDNNLKKKQTLLMQEKNL